MKAIGDLMHRSPSADERKTLIHVVELAVAWQAGDIGLAGVRSQCTGQERWQAMRFAVLGSGDKHALMALADALVRDQDDPAPMHHGPFSVFIERDDLYSGFVKRTANADGEVVFVWPMHLMDGVPAYPRTESPRGEERQRREEAMTRAYNAYRDKKGRARA